MPRSASSAPADSAHGPEQMKELVAYLAKNLVDKTDEIEVEDIEEDDGLVIELTVAEEDLGKVIGKEGKTARAMRSVLSAAASKIHRRVILEILE